MSCCELSQHKGYAKRQNTFFQNFFTPDHQIPISTFAEVLRYKVYLRKLFFRLFQVLQVAVLSVPLNSICSTPWPNLYVVGLISIFSF